MFAGPLGRHPARTMRAEATAGHWSAPVRGRERADVDGNLVETLRHGVPGSVEALLAIHGARIHRLASRITCDEQDAEEVVQDVLLTVTRKIDGFKGWACFRSWLHRIVVNTALLKRRRRHGRQAEVAWDAPWQPGDEPGRELRPPDPALEKELRAVLSSAIGDLPVDHRTTFLWHDVEGRSSTEIARALHISVPAVRTRLHRSRLFLRTRLTEYAVR